ncbi:hypothetical protein ABZ635_15960 [Nocardiopsis sp. NPDC007018]|uniref:hypothetical protein n=1 Tax=Nocardiopsis sp. NPDC007018 TaxID=3155721 RepID=UPI0033F71206
MPVDDLSEDLDVANRAGSEADEFVLSRMVHVSGAAGSKTAPTYPEEGGVVLYTPPSFTNTG